HAVHEAGLPAPLVAQHAHLRFGDDRRHGLVLDRKGVGCEPRPGRGVARAWGLRGAPPGGAGGGPAGAPPGPGAGGGGGGGGPGRGRMGVRGTAGGISGTTTAGPRVTGGAAAAATAVRRVALRKLSPSAEGRSADDPAADDGPAVPPSPGAIGPILSP